MKTPINDAKNPVKLSCYQQSSDTPVVLLHCSGGDHRYWLGIESYLGNEFQVLTPDFKGYGANEAFIAKVNGTNSDLDDIKTLLASIAKPCHLVGHSYGGALAIETALAMPEKLKSLTLVEPVAFPLLDSPRYAEVLAEFIAVGEYMKSAVAGGQLLSAAEAFFSYWHSPEAWRVIPVEVQQRMARHMRKVVSEFATVNESTATWQHLRKLSIPLHFIKGSETRPIIHHWFDECQQQLTNPNISVVKGAGHMSPASHKSEVFETITRFIQAQSFLYPELNIA